MRRSRWASPLRQALPSRRSCGASAPRRTPTRSTWRLSSRWFLGCCAGNPWSAPAGSSPADPHQSRRADRAIVLAAALFGVALANHALALLMVPPIGLYVLAVEPRILAAPAARARGCRDVPGRRGTLLPGAAAAGRPVPRATRLRPPRDVGRLLVRRSGQPVPGHASRARSRTSAGEGGCARRPGGARSSGRWWRSIPSGLAVTIARYPRYALLSASGNRLHRPLRRLLRERRDRPLLPGARVLRVDMDRGAGRSSSWRRVRLPRRTSGADGVPASSLMRAVPAFARSGSCSWRPPSSRCRCAGTRSTARHDSLDGRLVERCVRRAGAQRGRGVLVVVLDAAVVWPARRGPAQGRLGRR